MTDTEMKMVLKAQQGELDAVLMYNALAQAAKDPEDAETFRKLAADEGRHASVFREMSGQVLQAKRTKAIFLPMLYRLIGRKRLYPLIAKGEYDAAANYEPLAESFPAVKSVRDDEQRHGDTVMGLLGDRTP